MSSESGGKAKEPRDGSKMAPPTAKRHKSNGAGRTQCSLLLEPLDTQPEILRHMYSFLSLKEALVLRLTHRQFNDDANDLYRSSYLMNPDILKERGLSCDDRLNYMKKQHRALCNLSDENLRAVLRNKTIDSTFVAHFIWFLLDYEYSTRDNAQAVAILLEDGRAKTNIEQLEDLLRKDLTAMAQVLQQDERVKKGIQMCGTCSANIGCYTCTSWGHCVHAQGRRYCRECVKNDHRFCGACKDYLCPACFEGGRLVIHVTE